jgi:hypothetical protein
MAVFVHELRALVLPNGGKKAAADWYGPLTRQKRQKIWAFLLVAERMPELLDAQARVYIYDRIVTPRTTHLIRLPTRIIEPLEDRRKQLAEDLLVVEKVLPVFDEVAHSESKPFQHEHFQIVTVAGATQEHLRHVVESLNQATTALKARFAEVLYGKVFVSPNRQIRGRAAYYTSADDVLFINVNVVAGATTVHAIVHELGHRYENLFATDKMLEAVQDYVRLCYGRSVSAYASRVPSETFAEAFRLYVLGEPLPAQLKKLFDAAAKKTASPHARS